MNVDSGIFQQQNAEILVNVIDAFYRLQQQYVSWEKASMSDDAL
jgi:hypothetical protein